MAISLPSLSDLETQVASFFATRFPGRDLGSESFLGKQARATAMALLSIQKAIGDADNDGTPSAKTSTAALDGFAILFGLVSNLGGYGRNGAVAASGGGATLTGAAGTVYVDGSLLLASDGVTSIRLSGGLTIPAGATSIAGASFIAVTAGLAGNLAVGSILTWVSAPPGADATVSLTSPLTGGLNKETDAALLQRILDRLQKPPKGGAAVDYRTWAQTPAAAGVQRAYVYPNRGGTGTVQVVLTAGGSGTGRRPSLAAQTADDTYVNGVRPVTVQAYASLLPAMPSTRGHAIRARLTAALSKYAFDWVDTAATYTVAVYAAGPPAVLTLNVAAPASLVNAINNGLRPRLQVIATSGPVVPVQVRVTAIAGPANVALTLENPLPTGLFLGAPGAAPTVGDRVFAGGPMATVIGQALLAYVDGLGPSRADGSADPNDIWSDTIAVARLTSIALTTLDPADNLTAFASNMAVAGGVTIDAGTNDVVGLGDLLDTLPAAHNAPELLYATSVVVTQ